MLRLAETSDAVQEQKNDCDYDTQSRGGSAQLLLIFASFKFLAFLFWAVARQGAHIRRQSLAEHHLGNRRAQKQDAAVQFPVP